MNRYKARFDGVCDEVGADTNSTDKFCYRCSPAVCHLAVNYANGICYPYRVDAEPEQCAHGYYDKGYCHYDTRHYSGSRKSSCNTGVGDHIDGYCYYTDVDEVLTKM